MEQKLYDAAAKLPETTLEFSEIQAALPEKRITAGRRIRQRVTAAAACIVLLLGVGLGTYGCAAEAKEYNNAVKFFAENFLSTEGLTRGDIKAVYRDITTESFTYSKTAEVIRQSLITNHVGGYDIHQPPPSPEDIEELWKYKKNADVFWMFDIRRTRGIHYESHSEYKRDDHTGREILDRSYLYKYDGDTLVWSAFVTEFSIRSWNVVSDGVIAFGGKYINGRNFEWMAKIDANGNVLWKRTVNNGFDNEYVVTVLENHDGSYAVIGRGNWQYDEGYLGISEFTADGTKTDFHKTKIGAYTIQNAAHFADGFLVQLQNYQETEPDKILKTDRIGNITESFTYGSEDADYYIQDMIEFDGKIYVSSYVVPKQENSEFVAGRSREIKGLIDFVSTKLYSEGLYEWDSEKLSREVLTPFARDYYTAVLLVCDPQMGDPQVFFSVKGSLGSKLSVQDNGMLQWNVENITATYYSPATSAFSFYGTNYVYHYTFDVNGRLFSQKKTGQTASYVR